MRLDGRCDYLCPGPRRHDARQPRLKLNNYSSYYSADLSGTAVIMRLPALAALSLLPWAMSTAVNVHLRHGQKHETIYYSVPVGKNAAVATALRLRTCCGHVLATAERKHLLTLLGESRSNHPTSAYITGSTKDVSCALYRDATQIGKDFGQTDGELGGYTLLPKKVKCWHVQSL